MLLGGVTYISSSGVIAKTFAEGREFTSQVRTVVISIAALEDLAMALYLPLAIVILNRLALPAAMLYALIPVAAVAAVLFLAVRYGRTVSRLAAHQSDEVILLTSLGTVLLVAGIAQRLRVSEAVGAFLVGIAWSGPFAAHTRRVIEPLRDFFASLFFLFFGLRIDLASLPPVLWPALGLTGLTALTKILTGWWATRGRGIDVLGRLRAGAALVARGEFSIVIAALAVGAGLNPALGALAAAYVLFQGILGPLLTRGMGPFATFARRGSGTAVP
jgi:CPA2 family monovalent cation:H+ antiporter-2